MIQAIVTDSARQAGRILHAWRNGEFPRLAPGLHRPDTPDNPMPAAEVERWELLEGIVEQMCRSLAARREPGDPAPDPTEVYERLLEHLTGSSTRTRPLPPSESCVPPATVPAAETIRQ